MINQPGTIYLLHFDRPYRHAGHYLGWASNLEGRLWHHRNGTGSRLMAAVSSAGIGWRVAATWPGTRSDERRMKNGGGSSRYCPLCTACPRPWVDRLRETQKEAG